VSIIGQYEKIINIASKGLNSISGGAIFAMALLTCADVMMRFFGGPIRGALDIVRFPIRYNRLLCYCVHSGSEGTHLYGVCGVTIAGRSKAMLKALLLLSLGLFALLARQSCLLLGVYGSPVKYQRLFKYLSFH